MKIDTGTSGHKYPTPPYYAGRDANDAAVAEETVKVRSANPSISRTYLSPSLANALWAVERERKSAASPAPTRDEQSEGPNGGVLGKYLEFAASSSDEFH